MRKLLLPAFAALLFFSSCGRMFGSAIEGSYDISEESEGGPSALSNSGDVGFNLAMEAGWGSIGAQGPFTIKPDGAVHNDWFPYDYKPLKKSENSINFASGLELVRKGSKFDGATTGLTYLNGFTDIRYNHGFDDGGSLFAGLGPYIGYGIGGKVKGGGFSEPAFGGADGYKRFDAGLHLKGGYQFSGGLRFALGYEFGLFNKSPAPDFTSRNRTFSISVGYSVTKIIAAFKKK